MYSCAGEQSAVSLGAPTNVLLYSLVLVQQWLITSDSVAILMWYWCNTGVVLVCIISLVSQFSWCYITISSMLMCLAGVGHRKSKRNASLYFFSRESEYSRILEISPCTLPGFGTVIRTIQVHLSPYHNFAPIILLLTVILFFYSHCIFIFHVQCTLPDNLCTSSTVDTHGTVDSGRSISGKSWV